MTRKKEVKKNNNNSKKSDNNNRLDSDRAAELIRQPYITEKTFNMIERENKLTFIVADTATKKNIADSLESLYATEVTEVNTSKTVRGKKAVVRFATPDGARDLATKLGLV
jgi:large subunit ribosomal protein L23